MIKQIVNDMFEKYGKDNVINAMKSVDAHWSMGKTNDPAMVFDPKHDYSNGMFGKTNVAGKCEYVHYLMHGNTPMSKINATDFTAYKPQTPPNTKPFNLERALAGDKVVNTDGVEVTGLVRFDDVDCNFKVVGSMKAHGITGVYKFNDEGLLLNGSANKSYLFMAVKKEKRWIAVDNKSERLSFGELLKEKPCTVKDKSLYDTHRIIEIEIEV